MKKIDTPLFPLVQVHERKSVLFTDVKNRVSILFHESLNLESVKSLPLCRLESEYSGAILELKSRQMFDRSSSHHQAHHLSEFCRPMLESGFRQT